VNDHELAVDLAIKAGKILVTLRVRLEAEGAWPEEIMDAGDAAAHRFLMDELTRHRPDDAVLSEEGADDQRRLAARRVWIVDPLDGTREYGEPGRSDWAVHVALWEDARLSAGAVSLPAFEMAFGTDPPPVLPTVPERRPRMITSRFRAPYVAAVIAEALDADAVRLGSAGAKAMAVVMGEADIYAHAGGMYEWDSAAPIAVAAAAGLHVSRIDGSPLVYNQPDPWMPDLLICRPELANAALTAAQSIGKYEPGR
jgi:3'(2'), 5'-bisphosphate nucleotidase